MSEFETIGDLFEVDRHPTRPLEPIQKVDQVDEIERDIEEFYETPSAKTVLEETTEIVTDRGGQQRFRYVHATFGSGKSHLLKLIGVATGEIDGLEAAAHKLSNETTGFRAFRESLEASYIDHLHPLLMNLLDRDRQDAGLPLLLFEELGRRRGYPTDRPWLLEFSWRLDITHDLWEPLQSTTVEDLTFGDVADRPTSLRAWLTEAIPQLDGAAEAGLDSAEAVTNEIDAATATVSEGSFTPEQLVERLVDTRSHLNNGTAVHEFLIGLDEIAIYVGDSPARYQEVVETIEALFEGVGCPIIGTGQWPLRDMQQKFVGDVVDEAWYTREVKLEGADTETIVRKRWLQKSDDGTKHIKSEVLGESPPLEPEVSDPDTIADHGDPAEAYPFRDRDLGLLRAAMQGLIEGDRESERDYIQGRALLVRVRSLFDTHGWATREPGAIVSWDLLYDVLRADTALIPEWAHDLVERVGDSAEADPDVDATLAVRTTKALFLLSQLDFVPRTASTLARLLTQSVTVDLDQLEADVAEQLEALVEKNLIREDVDTSPTEYTILSEEDITFWQEVRQAAAEIPHPQFRANVRQYIQEAGSDRLTDDDIIDTADFGDYSDVPYTVRYTIDTSLSSSPTERHDALVVRLLAADSDGSENYIESWQETHSGPQGVEDVLIVVNLPEGLRQQILQLIAMKQVLDSMADPRPKLRLQRQTDEETIEDEIAAQLESAAVYLPSRAGQYGEYLDDFEAAVAGRVDSKFPNRKTIETQIQQGDLQALIDFFEGGGSWPLTDRDAQTLGVNTVPRTIDNGWVADFLDSFEGEDRVSGERIVETINGRRGEFLGTPMNALHALLFVLVAAREIEVRADGERLTEPATIASHITRKGRLTAAVIGFDPQPPPEGLEEVYQSLLGREPDTNDAAVLCSDLAEWVTQNSSRFRTVVTRTNMVFGSDITLEDLKTALEPALTGDPLDPPLLNKQSIVDQAALYATVEPLFTGEDEPTRWEQYTATYETVSELYPTASEVKQMQPYADGYRVPEQTLVADQIEAAERLRTKKLQQLYEQLANTQTPTEDLETLRTDITDVLAGSEFEATLSEIESTFEAVSVEALRELTTTATEQEEPLAEAPLADPAVRSQAETVAAGRALLAADIDGDSLYEELQAVYEALQDDHETSFAAEQLGRAIDGTAIPDPDRARRLLSQGKSLLDSDDDDEELEEPDALDQLWQQVTAHGEGTIVVIDTEADQ